MIMSSYIICASTHWTVEFMYWPDNWICGPLEDPTKDPFVWLLTQNNNMHNNIP